MDTEGGILQLDVAGWSKDKQDESWQHAEIDAKNQYKEKRKKAFIYFCKVAIKDFQAKIKEAETAENINDLIDLFSYHTRCYERELEEENESITDKAKNALCDTFADYQTKVSKYLQENKIEELKAYVAQQEEERKWIW